ncbi:glycosyltransferase family 4 protein [Dictyobacter arantiisoli]|uniref:Glycosyltransferase WbuB n=1 Tax=Dictyobacter arantiisoli TaxID=2014874 RepID=A0A5A5T7K5_9CHLR|nr:glycosyltransferase family 4 protein [Dictyobacter arantiisoli]GCF06929.1 glycosyltransferase WbuB [Dictyobacter arantiisoli]
MHVLFIARYYYPEKAAAAVCVGETAQRLLHYGHQVTVLTTVPSYPTGHVPRRYRGHILQTEIIEGVRVIRTWSYASPNTGFFKRILSYLSFGCLTAMIGSAALGSPDIIIVESPPLFTVLAAHLLSWRKRCPYIFWVADLWPESAVQLGALHNPLLIKFATWLEWQTYQRARLVWAVTEGMRDTLIQRGVPASKVFLLHNGVDTERFRPQSQSEARQLLGWDNAFIILYAGTHGLTHGLHTILDAAAETSKQADIRYVLIGDGAEKAQLVAEAQRRQLHNIHFLDPLPHEQMPTILAAADVCLAHTRNLPLLSAMLPIKMYEAMACGRPLLLAVNGEARRIAEQEAQAAIYSEPENASALAQTVLYLQTHPDIVKQLGQHGHSYIQQHFNYDLLTATLHARLQRIIPHPAGKWTRAIGSQYQE